MNNDFKEKIIIYENGGDPGKIKNLGNTGNLGNPGNYGNTGKFGNIGGISNHSNE